MDTKLIGEISGGLVIISIIPYALRVYQKKIKTIPTTWFLWSVIGLALLLTYKSSGANESMWPAVFGFTNPLFYFYLNLQKSKPVEKT